MDSIFIYNIIYSNDVRNMSKQTLGIYGAEEIVAVDQVLSTPTTAVFTHTHIYI